MKPMRSFPPLSTIHVKRIVVPKNLPRHTKCAGFARNIHHLRRLCERKQVVKIAWHKEVKYFSVIERL